ncbi:MAG: hypothetical protein RL398_3479 [Planctomycetota bacterium]|jgi:hypothetical protein
MDPRLAELLDGIAFAHEREQTLPGDDHEARSFERAAALAAAAFAGNEATPAALSQRLAAAGLHFCAEQRSAKAARPTPGFVTAPRQPRSGTLFGFLSGVAAAALLWFFASAPTTPGDLGQARTQLLAKAGVQQLGWKTGPSPLAGAVQGDVVWSAEDQAGYLTFRGLPPLDPERTFQLWIVDGERPGSAPIDGGLFAITDAKAETVVRIDPKLNVRRAAAFVVTVEAKDGAVVSKQEHVVAIAGL